MFQITITGNKSEIVCRGQNNHFIVHSYGISIMYEYLQQDEFHTCHRVLLASCVSLELYLLGAAPLHTQRHLTRLYYFCSFAVIKNPIGKKYELPLDGKWTQRERSACFVCNKSLVNTLRIWVVKQTVKWGNNELFLPDPQLLAIHVPVVTLTHKRRQTLRRIVSMNLPG